MSISRHAELEVPRQVLLVDRPAALDPLERREVVFQEAEALADDRAVALAERGADPERIEQLEMDPPRRVERWRDVALERLEAAGRPG